jgi:putative transcriptional regulator
MLDIMYNMLYYSSSMSEPSELTVHLRRFRFENGEMTQQELADKVGVTRQTIISIEKGKYQPSIVLALRLAQAFGVPVESLFELNAKEHK